jgi:hypothetical protein
MVLLSYSLLLCLLPATGFRMIAARWCQTSDAACHPTDPPAQSKLYADSVVLLAGPDTVTTQSRGQVAYVRQEHRATDDIRDCLLSGWLA